MKTSLTFVLYCLSICFSLSPVEANDFNLPYFECQNKMLCAYDLQDQVKSYYDKLNTNTKMNKNLYDDLSRSQILVPQFQSNTTFIVTHGLFLDGAQFSSLYEYLLSLENAPNIISLVLEGHGFDEENLLDVKYKNWLSSLNNAISMAEQIGDKIVLVGQSTGGLLSTYMAFQYPEKINGMILVEPALKVSLLIEKTACMSPSLSFDLEYFRGLVEQFASIPERRKVISPVTGCEVVRTTKRLIKKFAKSNLKKLKGQNGRPKSMRLDEKRVQKMFEQLKMPIALFNHPNDLVVSPKWNKYLGKFSKGVLFYKEVNSAPYTTIPRSEIDLEATNQQEIRKDLEDIKHGDFLSIERMAMDPEFQSFVEERFLN